MEPLGFKITCTLSIPVNVMESIMYIRQKQIFEWKEKSMVKK